MRDSTWNECEAVFVAAYAGERETVALTCNLGKHCDPQDATAEHKDPSGLRWRYPEDEADD